MIKLLDAGLYSEGIFTESEEHIAARENTISYNILQAHNSSSDLSRLRLKFDALASHDITYVGIIQTARASGIDKFPLPYVLTNCHNSLCAVGGTINEDDHAYGLSAAIKYGGIFVPPHFAVIHQYMREMMAAPGNMILGSDSHTRYGALGTLAFGEGGGELAKQLLGKTYDIDYPDIVGVRLTGAPRYGTGPMDVALAIIGAVFPDGFAKNKILEFIGPGISNLSVDYRIGIDVMTTETACLSSIWATDEKVREFYKLHGREEVYKSLDEPKNAYYDAFVEVDLSKIPPMIAMPFHPCNVYPISELKENLEDIIHAVEKKAEKSLDANIPLNIHSKIKTIGGNKVLVPDQAIIAGCSGGTYENIVYTANILKDRVSMLNLSVYPASQPIFARLVEDGNMSLLLSAGVVLRSAFCGPCFGAGDVPQNNGLSIRHVTRNFPHREGSKPSASQTASVAMMDALSIAASSLTGVITGADEVDFVPPTYEYMFNPDIYGNKIYQGFGKALPDTDLIFGPNITDWPKTPPLNKHLLLKVAAFIEDPVTTTDELIPSGEASSYRSNPLALAEFTLSRKDPKYVGRAKQIAELTPDSVEIKSVFTALKHDYTDTSIGSLIYANSPGDGSAREQAASCQKVLGGFANIALDYATKRYRSNLINWGILPFIINYKPPFTVGGYIYVRDITEALLSLKNDIEAIYIDINGKSHNIVLSLPNITRQEADILLAGCLINYYGG